MLEKMIVGFELELEVETALRSELPVKFTDTESSCGSPELNSMELMDTVNLLSTEKNVSQSQKEGKEERKGGRNARAHWKI